MALGDFFARRCRGSVENRGISATHLCPYTRHFNGLLAPQCARDAVCRPASRTDRDRYREGAIAWGRSVLCKWFFLASLSLQRLSQHLLTEFLQVLRSVWLPQQELSLPSVDLVEPTEGMTFRSWHALQAELDPEERLYGVSGQLPIRSEKKWRFLGTTQALPAVLLAVTSHRLIAISTGASDTDGLYEMVIRSTAVRSLEAVKAEHTANGLVVFLKLKNDLVWKFPFEVDHVASVKCFLGIVERLAHPLQTSLPDALSQRSSIGSE